MTGTDRSKPTIAGGPAIILVEPQLGENIGMAARAMLNCGLTELRLVNPRQPFPNRYAIAAAAGADLVLDRTQVFPTLREAVADLHRVYASTARDRDMVKLTLTPRAAAPEIHAAMAGGIRCGILFGRERTGLTNEEVMAADTLVTVPLNPAYSSLNLAQAVLLIGYELFAFNDSSAGSEPPQQHTRGSRPATGEEMAGLFDQLERELDAAEFFRAEHMRPTMWRNLRNIFLRAQPTEQEVRTLHGVVAALVGRRRLRRS